MSEDIAEMKQKNSESKHRDFNDVHLAPTRCGDFLPDFMIIATSHRDSRFLFIERIPLLPLRDGKAVAAKARTTTLAVPARSILCQ